MSLRLTLIEHSAFGGGRPCDSPRDGAVSLELAWGEDDDVAGDAEAVQRAVHLHNQTAPSAMNGENDEQIDIASCVGSPACLRTEENDPLWAEAVHEAARGFLEGFLVDGSPEAVIIQPK